MIKQVLRVTMLVILLPACAASVVGNSETSIPKPTSSQELTPIPNVLYVDPDIDEGPISPYIFGSNYGPWTAVPAGKMGDALNSHVTVLRFPGGEWGDQNDLQKYQLDLFMDLLNKMHSIPTISVRLLNGTPQAAAQLVHYANIEMGYKVRYWSIGNEPDLYENRPNVDYDTIQFNQEWQAIALAMKAVDPTIQLLGPELSGSYTSNFSTNPKDTAGRDWMTEFLKANSDLVDIVTYHRYPFPIARTANNATADEMRQDLPEWTRTVQYLHQLIQETTGKDLRIGVTEASGYYNPAVQGLTTPDSLFHAIWWADVLGQMVDENVFMVNQWDFTTASGQNGGWGLLSIGGVRPEYYDYQLYSLFGTERVYAASGVAGVSVYSAKRNDGTLTVLIVNMSDSQQHVPLQIHGFKAARAEVWLFDAAHAAENLGAQALRGDGMLDLPAQSVSLYTITK